MIRSEFKGYNFSTFGKDLLAGITVTAVALPLALAFGVSSGATAAAGLVTAILAGLIIGGFSGGSYQISGPTGAMSAILITLVAQYGLQGVFLACFLSGIILLLAGIFKLGNLVSFIPAPVITGFTSGIAVIIAIGQIDNLTGFKAKGDETIEKITSYFTSPQQIDFTALIIGLSVIIFMFIYPKKLSKYCPASLLSIVIVTALNLFFHFDAASVGEIPKSIFLADRLNLTEINLSSLSNVVAPAISIAALGLIESLLCGASAGRMKNEKLDSDIELVAQGIGNIIIPFFGGVPATAAIARTSVAIKSGGKTRVTSIIHALVLLLSMFLLAPVMSEILLSALAGVLIVTAWHMNEWKSIKNIFSKRYYTAMLQFTITMAATVVFDLTIAILIGVVLSLALFVVNISKMQITVSEVDGSKLQDGVYYPGYKHTRVVYLAGPLYFGTANQLAAKFSDSSNKSEIIFSMRGVPFTDLTGVQILLELCEKLKTEQTEIYFTSVQPKVMENFYRYNAVDIIGEDKFFWSADQALKEIANKVKRDA
jgi:Sulfate permease and related transporters (MFS superfamily)